MSSPLSRSSKPARLSPFFRDLASPISSHHRSGGRLASNPGQAAVVSAFWKESLSVAEPPPPPVFTLDDRADFSPEPGLGDPPSPSPDSRSSTGRRTPTPPRLERKGSVSCSPSLSSSFALRTAPEGSGSVVVNGVKDPGSSSWKSSPKAGGGERGKGLASPADGMVKPWPLVTLPSPSEVARPEPERNDAANGGPDEEKWITVFGFTPADTNLILREFEKCGLILKHVPGPRSANWIHILYRSNYDARKALEKNGTQLNSRLIIGVKLVDPMHRPHLSEARSKVNHGEFMVSLPWKSAVPNSSADPKPSETSKTAIVTGGRPSTGAVATPANSIVSRVLDVMFGI